MTICVDAEDVSKPQTEIYSAPIKAHPTRPVIVWVVGRFFFALNLSSNNYEAWRRTESCEPVRSIEFLPAENGPARWLLTTDDKTIVVLNDVTFTVEERFLLRKRPVAVCVCDQGDALIWGDRFGDLMKLSFANARIMTNAILRETCSHLNNNAKDIAGLKAAEHIQKQFAGHLALASTATTACGDTITDQTNETSEGVADEDDDGNVDNLSTILTPFAGHMAAITAVAITPDGTKIISADRDEKARIGSVRQPHITLGYCLGHTEFITSLCFVGTPGNLSNLFVTGSGDKSLRLWDISETGVQLDEVNLSAVPCAVYFSQSAMSCLVIFEGVNGVTVVPLKHSSPTDYCSWAFDASSLRIIALPDTPLSLLPIDIDRSLLELSAFSGLSFLGAASKKHGVPAFFWTDRCGQLHVPVAISNGDPLLANTQEAKWIGEATGEPIIVKPLLLWKHNREPTAPSETEKRLKRLCHRQMTKTITTPAVVTEI